MNLATLGRWSRLHRLLLHCVGYIATMEGRGNYERDRRETMQNASAWMFSSSIVGKGRQSSRLGRVW